MSDFELLLSWPLANPDGFWVGIITPASLALIAFFYSRKVLGYKQQQHLPLLMIGLFAGMVDIAFHVFWLWPSGIIPNGNLAGGTIVVATLLVPSVFRSVQSKLPSPAPIDAFWMAWFVLIITDIVVSCIQPGGISKFSGIGAKGFHDALFIAPSLIFIAAILIGRTFKPGFPHGRKKYDS